MSGVVPFDALADGVLQGTLARNKRVFLVIAADVVRVDVIAIVVPLSVSQSHNAASHRSWGDGNTRMVKGVNVPEHFSTVDCATLTCIG